MKQRKNKWLRLSTLIIIGTVLNVVAILFLGNIFDLFVDQPKQEYLDELSSEELLIMGVIFAPLLESLLIILVIYIFQTFTKNTITTIIVTGILFGLGHYAPGESWTTPIVLAVSGMIYTVFYLKAKNQQVSGYVTIAVMHGISNLLMILPNMS